MLGVHAAHFLGHEVQHLADEDLVGLGIAEGLRHEQRGGLTQGTAEDAGSAADGAFRQRQAVDQVIAQACVFTPTVRVVRHGRSR